jgi:hypothetical protein
MPSPVTGQTYSVCRAAGEHTHRERTRTIPSPLSMNIMSLVNMRVMMQSFSSWSVVVGA